MDTPVYTVRMWTYFVRHFSHLSEGFTVWISHYQVSELLIVGKVEKKQMILMSLVFFFFLVIFN